MLTPSGEASPRSLPPTDMERSRSLQHAGSGKAADLGALIQLSNGLHGAVARAAYKVEVSTSDLPNAGTDATVRRAPIASAQRT
eukprot:365095-Chlamydomonas_euryale.AAC.7